MTTNILNEFKKILNELTWMDIQSKNSALTKANAMKSQIGYPDLIFNDTYLEALYKVQLEYKD